MGATNRAEMVTALDAAIANWATPQGAVSVDYFEREEFTAELADALLAARVRAELAAARTEPAPTSEETA